VLVAVVLAGIVASACVTGSVSGEFSGRTALFSREIGRPFMPQKISELLGFSVCSAVLAEVLPLELQKGFVRVLTGPQNDLVEVLFFEFGFDSP
jgi:hypothetical protein